MLEKLFIFIFIVYIEWFKEAYYDVPIILYGSILGAISCWFLRIILFDKKIKIKYTSKVGVNLVFFGMYSLISGIFIYKDSVFFFNQLFTYFCFVIVCILITYISNQYKDSNWLLKIFIVGSFLCSIQTILYPYPYYNGIIVTSMSKHNNPNTLGLVMCIGLYSVLILNYKKNLSNKISFVSMTLYIYIIILSGSRKSLFVAISIFLCFMVNYFFKKERNKKIELLKKVLLIFGIIFIIIFVGSHLVNYYQSTSSFERMSNLNMNNSRFLLYKEAFELWKINPLFGIGFNQYAILSSFKYYSHSTYAEILSCTGLLGFIIFFIPIIRLFFNLMKDSLKKKNKNRNYYRILLLILIFELFLGIGQIFIYEFYHLVILNYIFSEVENLKRSEKRYENKKISR